MLAQLLAPGQNGRQELLLEPTLTREIANAIGNVLGAKFDANFIVKNLPQGYLQIESHRTYFNIPDIESGREVLTGVQLELKNFQKFRRAGLNNDQDAISQVQRIIDDGVKKYLFGKNYYEIASKFDSHLKMRSKSMSQKNWKKLVITLIFSNPYQTWVCLVLRADVGWK